MLDSDYRLNAAGAMKANTYSLRQSPWPVTSSAIPIRSSIGIGDRLSFIDGGFTGSRKTGSTA
jgi:hypothetical protein